MEEKDLSVIFVSSQIKECDVEFKGINFHFKYKDLPWVQITKIASRCLDYSGKKVVIDRSEYDIAFLEQSLVEAPWPLENTRSVIRKIDKNFGEKLRQAIIPAPSTEEDTELKKE
jgi:hypothetical protein